jgi:hypothetical protein
MYFDDWWRSEDRRYNSAGRTALVAWRAISRSKVLTHLLRVCLEDLDLPFGCELLADCPELFFLLRIVKFAGAFGFVEPKAIAEACDVGT